MSGRPTASSPTPTARPRSDPAADGAGTDPLAAVTAERDEYLDALRRMQAEFENYRKRIQKQQADEADRAARSLVEKLLPVLDVLDLAAAHLGDPGSDDATALVQATGLLNDVLAKAGLERVDPVGHAFDPTLHEAVGQAPQAVPDDAHAGGAGAGEARRGRRRRRRWSHDGPVVAQVMRAGYVLARDGRAAGHGPGAWVTDRRTSGRRRTGIED